MNTTTAFNTFTATAVLAVFAAAGLALAHVQAEPAMPIVKLERVVVVGKRSAQLARIEHLPRVVVQGRRSEVQLAQAEHRCADAQRC